MHCLYIPLCESLTFLRNGIHKLLEELSQIISHDAELILKGDFNARTSDVPDYIIDDSFSHFTLPDWWPTD